MDQSKPSTRKATRKVATLRKRAPGRPLRSSPDLRANLLDAAIACFVRKGIDGTSLRDIATEANVTPALLHYYFGDKAQLQQAVIAERLMPVFAALREPLARAGDDIAALVAGFVGGIGRIVAEHPWLPPLWVREVLCEGEAFRRGAGARRDQSGPRSAPADGVAGRLDTVSCCRRADLATPVRRRRSRLRSAAQAYAGTAGPRTGAGSCRLKCKSGR